MRTSAMLLLLTAGAVAGAEWKTDLGATLAEAKRAGRPVLVYVYDSV